MDLSASQRSIKSGVSSYTKQKEKLEKKSVNIVLEIKEAITNLVSIELAMAMENGQGGLSLFSSF